MKKTAQLFLISLTSMLFSSCAFMKLQEDLDKMAISGTIHGRVIHSKNLQGPIILIAYNEKNKIEQYKILYKNADYYAFMLPAGERYKILMFEDANKNMQYDPGELSAFWDNPEKTILKHGKNITTDIKLSEDTDIPQNLNTNIKNTDPKKGGQFTIKTGVIADLNKNKFSREAGVKGLWTPLSFLEKNGLGVYFMEKYDPAKIPILFVYGIGGYPQSWSTFFKDIDRSRYQPWFYYYPSGFRIGKAGKALNIIMKELHLKYKFRKLFIVAHSMGGLVSYDYIKRYRSETEDKDSYIKLFISISTPWGGDKDAEWAERAPAIIPCWDDLMPSSKFIKDLTPKAIGDKIPYYLLFSYRGDRKPFRLNNDNIVYLDSELRFDMQQRAEKIYGFNFSHTQILHHKDVINTCNKIFETYKK